jgi:HJR/Mrr/RecB family endonuclease
MPDDRDIIIPLAWCTTKDDIFDASETDQFLDNLNVVRDTMEAFTKERRRIGFNEMLRKPRNGSVNALSNQNYTIDDIDLMTGAEFEDLVAKIFTKLGFHVTITKTSGDQGIDVLAEKGVQRIGIQAKCYGSSVGNSAIQEAVAGKAFYNLNRVMVITNNVFTPSAVALAQANNVVLWDRTILADKLALL